MRGLPFSQVQSANAKGSLFAGTFGAVSTTWLSIEDAIVGLAIEATSAELVSPGQHEKWALHLHTCP